MSTYESYEAPNLEPSDFSIGDLCKLFRVLDVLEEAASMSHQHVQNLAKRDTPASEYLVAMQEYLFAQRSTLVDELRERPNTDDADGRMRLAVLVQYEAWCREFEPETVAQFLGSPLATEAGK